MRSQTNFCRTSTMVLILLLSFITSPVLSASFGRSRPLSHLSPVSQVSLGGPDGHINPHKKLIVSVSVPVSRRYHNIQRRWWAVSDPNNSGFLSGLGLRRDIDVSWDPSVASYGMSSDKLFSYLTRNESLEYPSDSMDFCLILDPNEHLFDVPVHILGTDGSTSEQTTLARRHDADNGANFLPMAFKGEAFRKIQFFDPLTRDIAEKWVPVGWARLTVDRDGMDPTVQGSWKVDDEEHLGVPSSIYHINTMDFMRNSIGKEFPSETELLSTVSGSKHVVWRDADLRTVQYNNFDIEDNDYNALLKSPKLEKRAIEMVDEDQNPFLGTIIDEHGPSFGLFKRADSTNNDTGNSGFSSGSNLASTVGDTSGCPHPRKIALIGIAGDCNFIQQFNSTSEANSHIISTVNSASQVFEQGFNITLGLSQIVLVNSTTCPSSSDNAPDAQKWNYDCASSNDIGERLSLFSTWRGTRSDDGLATWSLMTNCAQGGVVGLSWLGMACQAATTQNSNTSAVSSTNVVSHTTLDWRVLAHELGHSYGAVHDCTSDTCSQGLENSSACCPLSAGTCNANGQYIMNPSSSDSQDTFSPCTQGNICGAISRNAVNATCLTSNTGVRLVTENECGNGIVEQGEECDCGGEAGCQNNSCCDPKTCKFTAGSQCDDSNDSCCNSCKFASSSTICRQSQSSCDPAEFCTGNSTICPADVINPNGQSCKIANSTVSNLKCASGQCTSRDVQCLTLLSNSAYTVDGQSLNVTKACDDDSSCLLSCVDPRFGSVCFTTSQNFLDGTPCQGTGTCSKGRCTGVSPYSPNSNRGPFDGAWFDRHKGVVIGIICAVGGLVLVAIIWGFIRREMVRKRMVNAYKQQGHNRQAGMRPPPPPPPQMSSGIYPIPPPFVPTRGASFAPPPGPPPQTFNTPPAYTNYSGNQDYEMRQFAGSTPPIPPRRYG